LKELKDKFKKEVDPGGSSLVELDGAKISLADLRNVIGAPSLFARKRMIVVENIFLNKSKNLLDETLVYLEGMNKKDKKSKNENIIIFWEDIDEKEKSKNKFFKLLLKQKYTQNFKTFSNTQASSWIRGEAKKRGADLKPQAAFKLTSLFGGDLWSLSNELNKLINFKSARKAELLEGGLVEIAEDDVHDLSRGRADANIFGFIDALSNKNKSLALELMENEIEAGAVPIYLLYMIVRQFRILMQVKELQVEGASSKKIMANLKLHPFVLKKAEMQAHKFELADLKNIFSELVLMDRELKIGKTDFKTALSLLVMDY
jgi:DNA polymerase-3 subunit delta